MRIRIEIEISGDRFGEDPYHTRLWEEEFSMMPSTETINLLIDRVREGLNFLGVKEDG